MINNKSAFYARMRQEYTTNPFIALLGVEIVDIKEGEVVVRLPEVKPEHTNSFGAGHGGALATLADTAMGQACTSTGKKSVTLELNINFIKSARAGNCLTATGKVVHNGNSTMIAEAEIRNEHDQLIAKSRGTFYITGQHEI